MKDEGKGKWGDFSSAIHYPDILVSARPVRKRTHVIGLSISTTKRDGFSDIQTLLKNNVLTFRITFKSLIAGMRVIEQYGQHQQKTNRK